MCAFSPSSREDTILQPLFWSSDFYTLLCDFLQAMSIGVTLRIHYLGLDTLCPTDYIHFEASWIAVIISVVAK